MSPVIEPHRSRPAERAASPDALLDVQLELAHTSRMSMRVRPDGLVEIATVDGVIGFVEYVDPIYVVLAGPWPAASIEIAQRRSLPDAVEALRRAIAAG